MSLAFVPLALGPLALPGAGAEAAPPDPIAISASGTILDVSLVGLPLGTYRVHVGLAGDMTDAVASLVDYPHATLLTVTGLFSPTVRICTPALVPGGPYKLFVANIRGGGVLFITTFTVLPVQVLSRTSAVRRMLVPNALNVGKLRF